MGDKKGKAVRSNIENAFDVYCQEGGNAESARRRLEKEEGLKLTRKSFKKWMVDYNFESRRVEMDAKRQADKEATSTAWARSVKGLLNVMTGYENYMASDDFLNSKTGKPDDQSVYAYASVVGQLRLLLRKFDYLKEDESLPDENVKVKASEILRDYYGIG